MDHSMVTAMRCAEHIHGEIAHKKAVWEVNTEQEYHEQKTEETGENHE
jgi:hypothetical protein